MRRRLVILATPTLLIALVATVALWVRSVGRLDCVYVGSDRHRWNLISTDRALGVIRTQLVSPEPFGVGAYSEPARSWDLVLYMYYGYRTRTGDAWGFHFRNTTPSGPGSSYRFRTPAAVVPYWALTLALAGVTSACGWRVGRVIRARRRVLAGRCSHCGYDLRASAGRCPECGRSDVRGAPAAA
jgi:hypothetical protein